MSLRLPLQSLATVPRCPGVYGLYGGRGRHRHVAYLGIAKNLRRRVAQHLVGRNSGVVAGTGAACLNTDFVTEVVWWTERDFSDPATLEAAELYAFQHFDPALRSRAKKTERAKHLTKDPDFLARMYGLFASPPTGSIVLPSLRDLLRRLEALERKIARHERLLSRKESGAT
jgi:hypothetical protein